MSKNHLVGSGWTFPMDFDLPQSGPTMVSDDDLIQQSIFVLLNTRPGERIHNHGFGSNLKDYLFQVPDESMLANIKEEVANAIAQHEPRITLNEIRFDTDQIYDGYLNIHLIYEIEDSNQPGSMVFPFYVAEG